MPSSARSARRAKVLQKLPRQLHLKFVLPKQRLADRIAEIAGAQTPPNIPLIQEFVRSKTLRECSATIEEFVRDHRRDNDSRRLTPPPDLLAPVF